MKCFECGKGNLVSKPADVSGEVRGEKYTVRIDATVCDRCASQILSQAQSAAYGIAIADADRQKHGLLTSKELKDIRKKLSMNQQEFAAYVGVSAPSVKRWETGLIQDEANDRLIRLKTNLEAARRNVSDLEERLGEKPLTSKKESNKVITILVGRRMEASEWDFAGQQPALDVLTGALDFAVNHCPTA
jgi:putative zinc finger/helix-turn-helix YgiT family protein